MPNNTKKNRMIKQRDQSSVQKLAIEKRAADHQPAKYTFSFDCLDRSHELFNLGSDIAQPKTVSREWFLDWLDAMREISLTPIHRLKGGTFDLHPVDWEQANPQKPDDADQREYLQLRINKSKGRIIGFCSADTVFHIVWLDPHHNMTNSEGYGTATYYKTPKSEYELLIDLMKEKDERIARLESDVNDLLLK